MRVWAAVFTLHSGHVDSVSCARYIVSHQSRIFYRTYNGVRKIYVPLLLFSCVASQPLFMPLFWSRVIIVSVGDGLKGQRNCGDRQLGLSHNPAGDTLGTNRLIYLSRCCAILCAVNRGMYSH